MSVTEKGVYLEQGLDLVEWHLAVERGVVGVVRAPAKVVELNEDAVVVSRTWLKTILDSVDRAEVCGKQAGIGDVSASSTSTPARHLHTVPPKQQSRKQGHGNEGSGAWVAVGRGGCSSCPARCPQDGVQPCDADRILGESGVRGSIGGCRR